MTRPIQSNLLKQLSFPVPEKPPTHHVNPDYQPDKHLTEIIGDLFARHLEYAITQHLTQVSFFATLTEREISLLQKRNDLSDGLQVEISTDPTRLFNKKITISIDYNTNLVKKIFVAPKPPKDCSTEMAFVKKCKERLESYKDMDIMVDGKAVLSINYSLLLLLTKDSLIEEGIHALGEKITRNKEGRIEAVVPAFQGFPEKTKFFMEMVFSQNVPAHLSIDDMMVYLDWANLIGAFHTKASLFNALMKSSGLKEYCDKEENRELLKEFVSKDYIPKEVKKFIRQYIQFYGNTHFDQLSPAEKRELEIINNAYYKGDMDSNKAERHLMKLFKNLPKDQMQYLIRNSATASDAYSLSCISHTKGIRHVRMLINQDGSLTAVEKQFATLAALIRAL